MQNHRETVSDKEVQNTYELEACEIDNPASDVRPKRSIKSKEPVDTPKVTETTGTSIQTY